jgi:hypothetical protein
VSDVTTAPTTADDPTVLTDTEIIELDRVAVFLGGTCAKYTGREEIIIPGLMKLGVDMTRVFNPNLGYGMWNDHAGVREDYVKARAQHSLYILADPKDGRGNSVYSPFELATALYTQADRLIVLIDTAGLDEYTVKSLAKIAKDIRRIAPKVALFVDDYDGLVSHLASLLAA